jgi:hypothetical protein
MAQNRVNSFARWLLALGLLVAGIGLPTTAAAQEAGFCQPGQSPAFVFGFANLKLALGSVMGDPVECEHPNSDNGDTLQQTTTGLAIYRQATNTPEFTDGWNHWALTVQGLMAWTATDQPSASATPSQSAATPPPQSAPAPPANAIQCVDVGAGICLNSVSGLADTVVLLTRTTIATPLVRAAGKGGYTIRFGSLPADVLGLFSPTRRVVIISTDLLSYPAIDRAPVLAHELQHVSDWISQGRQLDTTAGCLATETNAFHTESETWLELHSGRLSLAANDLEQEFNSITRAIQTDPAGFAERLTTLYHDECSPQ